MIGIDTNVLLRLVLRDDLEQFQIAQTMIASLDETNPGFINIVTLCEYVWSMRRGLKLSRDGIIEALKALVESRDLIVEDEELVIETIDIMLESQGEFADILIARRNVAHGCHATVTFDRKAAKTVSAMELLG